MKQLSEEKTLDQINYSVLDLAPIIQGGSPANAFQNTKELAQHAEKWGYNRVWLAEHHSMPGIASSATSVVIGYVAAATERIRSAQGVSCYRIMHRLLLQSSLERSRQCIQGELTLV